MSKSKTKSKPINALLQVAIIMLVLFFFALIFKQVYKAEDLDIFTKLLFSFLFVCAIFYGLVIRTSLLSKLSKPMFGYEFFDINQHSWLLPIYIALTILLISNLFLYLI